PPFRGGTPGATIEQIQNGALVPPGQRRGVPADLNAVCLKAMHRLPGRRYASAGELADDLRRFLDGRPVRARPATALMRTGKWAARQPATAGLLVALLLTLGLTLFASTLMVSESARRAAEAQGVENAARNEIQAARQREREVGKARDETLAE